MGLADGELIAHRIYAAVRERILSGAYPPGSVLRQEDIARQLEVSRVPLREVFSKLEAEGFLLSRPRRGYAVVSLEAEEMAEIFDLRSVLERQAGQIAARKRSDGDLAALTELHQEMVAADASTPEGRQIWAQANRSFHERILAIGGRARLQRIALLLRDQVEPYVRMEVALSVDVAEAMQDHLEIIGALQAGDAELAGDLCSAHCRRTERRLLDHLGRE
ncbi:GntR family transcriptional regulator [Thioclava sp. GXIMD2076]|uniref:GntR family transcriptional regulator n=1 Tax=Thioclava sp. GXIMD2076 TaxID=3131931 RepID=UPI0030CE756B